MLHRVLLHGVSTRLADLGQLSKSLPALARLSVAGLMLLGSPTWLKAQYSGAEPVPEEVRVGFETITEEGSEQLLRTLTGQGFDGRGTGQEGFVRAAHFVAGKLAEYGFQPIGDRGTYFQNVPFRQVLGDVQASRVQIGELELAGRGQIGFVRVGGSHRAEGEIVIIRATGAAARVDRGTQLSGKIVILVTPERNAALELQILAAEASGIISLSTSPNNVPSLLRQGQPQLGPTPAVVEVTSGMRDEIAAALSVDVSLLTPLEQDGIDQVAQKVVASIDLKSVESEATVPNVVGWLPGSDPSVADEYVVIGAHLDHLGFQNGDLFPGADDNGSGSSAILQIARALHENPTKPRRSVLYIAFAAEELGLIGSAHYTDNPIMPLDKCVCMLNIDMIGRNEETAEEAATDNEDSIHLVGTMQLSKKLHEEVLEANKHVGFRFEYDEERVYRRSDHFSFARHGIPSSFLFGGFNPYYHQTTDTLDGINYSKIANCARLYYLVIYRAGEHGRYPLDAEDVQGL